MSSWLGTVLFVVAIAIAIGLHEWGHFITARWFGMRAERFFLGFGPTLWSTHRGETEYGVKLLQLGGFVRIAGMSPGDTRQPPVADQVFDPEAVAADRQQAATAERLPLEHQPAVPAQTWQRLAEELQRRGVPATQRRRLVAEASQRAGPDATPAEARQAFLQTAAERLPDTGRVGDLRHRVLRGDEGRFFHDRPARERAVVLAAGSVMHFLQAVVILFVAYWAFATQPVPAVQAVLEGSPADAAGLEPGDRILTVNGEPVNEFDEAKAIIEAHAGEPVILVVEGGRDRAELRTVRLTTALVVEGFDRDSALARAGFQPGDRIVSVAGQPVRGLADLEVPAHAGKVAVRVERYGEEIGTSQRVELSVPATARADLAAHATGLAGFVPRMGDLDALGALKATFVGEGSFPALVVGTFVAIGDVFGPEGLGAIPEQFAGAERDPAGGASLVGIAQIAGEGTRVAGLFFLLGIVASLNVFVGIFNLIPLPPLDGGHLAVLVVERGINVVRRTRGLPADYRVDPRTVTAIAVPVIIFVGMVALAFLVLDLTNPLRLPQ